jgi:hypothetical protein
VWRLLGSGALVAAGIVALIEDHRYRPEYGCTSHMLRACERGEGLYPLSGRLAETPYNILGALGWALAISGVVLVVVTLVSLAKAAKR